MDAHWNGGTQFKIQHLGNELLEDDDLTESIMYMGLYNDMLRSTSHEQALEDTNDSGEEGASTDNGW